MLLLIAAYLEGGLKTSIIDGSIECLRLLFTFNLCHFDPFWIIAYVEWKQESFHHYCFYGSVGWPLGMQYFCVAFGVQTSYCLLSFLEEYKLRITCSAKDCNFRKFGTKIMLICLVNKNGRFKYKFSLQDIFLLTAQDITWVCVYLFYFWKMIMKRPHSVNVQETPGVRK